MVWYSHLFKNFPQLVVIHTVKGFNAEAQSVLVSLLCFLAVSPPFFSVSFSLCVSPCILVGLFISLCIPQPPAPSLLLSGAFYSPLFSVPALLALDRLRRDEQAFPTRGPVSTLTHPDCSPLSS